jgi:hypothetical protein
MSREIKFRANSWSAAAIVVGLLAIESWAAPDWWTYRNVTTGPAPGDFAPVNAGQAKHMAAMAAADMDANLPGGAGTAVTARVAGFALTNNFVPLNRGQLKNLAKPFYDRLIAVGYTNGYPWTAAVTDDFSFAPANIGQLKNVFSFDLGDHDEDGMPDWWETFNGLTNSQPSAYSDADQDGLSDLVEYELGTNPNAWDTDGDGIGDRDEVVAQTNPMLNDTNTLTGTITVNSSTNALGGTVIAVSFNAGALRVLAAGSAGAMKPPEYAFGQTNNYGAGTANIAYYQAKSTAGPTGSSNMLKVLFLKVGTGGAPTSVSATNVQMKHAASASNFIPVSVSIAGVPPTL